MLAWAHVFYFDFWVVIVISLGAMSRPFMCCRIHMCDLFFCWRSRLGVVFVCLAHGRFFLIRGPCGHASFHRGFMLTFRSGSCLEFWFGLVFSYLNRGLWRLLVWDRSGIVGSLMPQARPNTFSLPSFVAKASIEQVPRKDFANLA